MDNVGTTFEDFFRAYGSTGVEIDPGLTTREFSEIEERYGFRFPPDLREFLSIGMPAGKGWLNWRRTPEKEIKRRLRWPLEGMLFDLRHGSFWLPEWGSMPRLAWFRYPIARKAVNKAPTMIPIYGHRYIPDSPCEVGNPVFSIYQTDIIIYGLNLRWYLRGEFEIDFLTKLDEEDFGDGECKPIEFWTRVMDESWEIEKRRNPRD